MNSYTLVQGLMAIAIMTGVTFLTRAIPFIFFSRKGSEPNKIILYLGKVLPPAMMGMLLVYCLKDTAVLSYPYGIPEAICVALAFLLHFWKRNNFISIFVSTVLYMFLIQVVFI